MNSIGGASKVEMSASCQEQVYDATSPDLARCFRQRGTNPERFFMNSTTSQEMTMERCTIIVNTRDRFSTTAQRLRLAHPEYQLARLYRQAQRFQPAALALTRATALNLVKGLVHAGR